MLKEKYKKVALCSQRRMYFHQSQCAARSATRSKWHRYSKDVC